MTDFITCKSGSKKPPESCDHCLNCQSSYSRNVDGVNLVCEWCGGISGPVSTVYETKTDRISTTIGRTGRRFLDVYPLGSDICGEAFYKADTDESITLHCHLPRSVSHLTHEAKAVFGHTSVSASWTQGMTPHISIESENILSPSGEYEPSDLRGDESEDFPFGKW